MTEIIKRAEDAKKVLENPVFQAALKEVENQITNAWKTAKEKDVDHREDLFRMLICLEKVKTYLTSTIVSGEMTKRQQRQLTNQRGIFG